MSILLDHCVPRRYLRLLNEWGYEASLLTDHTAADAPDDEVIRLARQLDAALLTVDMDFANVLVYPPQKYGGIIVMRYPIGEEEALDDTLRQMLAHLYRDELRGALIVVTPHRYRIRRGG